MRAKLQKGDALLIADPQNDFFPGGALAVPKGDEILPIINEWIKAAEQSDAPIIFSRDWHPENHISFKAQGGPWPPHCVQNTFGAEFHPDLYKPKNFIITSKATKPNKEEYSAFEGHTQNNKLLTEKLRELNVKRIWIAGLALDYCVYFSAIDAHKSGFEYHIILPGCRSIDKKTESKAITDMKAQGAILETDGSPYQ